jgi:hypothetical protein
VMQCVFRGLKFHFFAFSLRFYTEAFGMKLLRKRDVPEEKYANAFLGFGPETSNFVVELTYSMLHFKSFVFTHSVYHMYTVILLFYIPLLTIYCMFD